MRASTAPRGYWGSWQGHGPGGKVISDSRGSVVRQIVKAVTRASEPKVFDPADDESAALVASLVGHTIAAAVWVDMNPGETWEVDGEEAHLTLDDGRVIVFGAIGHDAWSATVKLRPAPTCARG